MKSVGVKINRINRDTIKDENIKFSNVLIINDKVLLINGSVLKIN